MACSPWFFPSLDAPTKPNSLLGHVTGLRPEPKTKDALTDQSKPILAGCAFLGVNGFLPLVPA